ncbi:MAG: hypothetical protein P8Y64_01405 [Gammaproteobacteria bacterium]
MTDRTYRLLLGALLLVLLYFNEAVLVYTVIGVLLFEGLTNLRIPLLFGLLKGPVRAAPADVTASGVAAAALPGFTTVDAERVWRLVIGGMLLLTYILLYEWLWAFPWFMAFAILGAGVSGVCPVMAFIRWLGFK